MSFLAKYRLSLFQRENRPEMTNKPIIFATCVKVLEVYLAVRAARCVATKNR
jgi:hypothetical protein